MKPRCVPLNCKLSRVALRVVGTLNLLLLAAGFTEPVAAQELHGTFVDPVVSPAVFGPPPSRMHEYEQPSVELIDHPHDLKVLQVRLGTVFPVGGGVYADRLETGFSVEAAGRVLFDLPDDGRVSFLELGAGYTGHQADSANPILVNGTLTATDANTNAVTTNRIANASSVRLNELHRAGVHAALGTTFTPAWLTEYTSTPWNFTARGGFRLGHARAYFDPTPNAAIVAQVNANPNLRFDLSNDLQNSDIYWGLLGSFGVGSAYSPLCLDHWYLGEVSWGAEVEYRYDWFDLGGFDADTTGVGGITTWFTCTIVR